MHCRYSAVVQSTYGQENSSLTKQNPDRILHQQVGLPYYTLCEVASRTPKPKAK